MNERDQLDARDKRLRCVTGDFGGDLVVVFLSAASSRAALAGADRRGWKNCWRGMATTRRSDALAGAAVSLGYESQDAISAYAELPGTARPSSF